MIAKQAFPWHANEKPASESLLAHHFSRKPEGRFSQ
jgi:hypothetical protein